MMDDRSFMAYIYRFLVWGSRNVGNQARDADGETGDNERNAGTRRRETPLSNMVEATPSASRPPMRDR